MQDSAASTDSVVWLQRLPAIGFGAALLLAPSWISSAPRQAEANASGTALSSAKSFVVMIDPAHGGSDVGSRFTATTTEKELTLAFARKLRGELQAEKIASVLLRDGDVLLTADQRAVAANIAHPAMFISIHAALPAGGIRVFTAMLQRQEPGSGGNLFLPWTAAQAPSLARSQDLASKMIAELHKEQIGASSQAAPLAPLNSIVAPAIAIELSPSTPDRRKAKKAGDVIKPEFQQAVARAIAKVIAAQREALEGPK